MQVIWGWGREVIPQNKVGIDLSLLVERKITFFVCPRLSNSFPHRKEKRIDYFSWKGHTMTI